MKSLSITQKFMMLLAPLLVMGASVSTVTWRALTGTSAELTNASALNESAIYSAIYVGQMSEALRGLLLDPTDDREFKNKKEADKNFTAVLEKMKKDAKDPEILKIISDIHEFDVKRLDPAETKILELVKEGKQQEAVNSFNKDYKPLVTAYQELNQSLRKKTDRHADEIIASTFDGMRTSAKTIMLTLFLGLSAVILAQIWTTKSIGRSLDRIASGLSEGAGTTESASKEVSSASSELSAGAVEQAAAIQETVSAVDEINAMVAKNAENAKHSKEISDESAKAAQKGKRVVEEMIRSIEEVSASNADIVNQIDANNREISDIVKVIHEIAAKTTVINDIVFQTKLLSFNASVEAARAGEHGKGFAVVAEEVGNLAQMSGNAAKEISALLEGSIQKVRTAVEESKANIERLVQIGKEKVSTSANVAKECGGVLDGIVAHVTQTDSMVSEIFVASEEQSRGIQEISKAMGQLDQVTNQNASASQQCSSAAQELNTKAAELRGLVASLVQIVRGGELVSRASTPTSTPAPAPTRQVRQLPRREIAPVLEFKKKPLPKGPTLVKSASRAVGTEYTPPHDDPRFEDV